MTACQIRFYLHISQVLSVIGFSFVMVVSPFWSQHKAVGLGFLITLVLIPFYVGVLVARINVARQRADDANRAKASKCVHDRDGEGKDIGRATGIS